MSGVVNGLKTLTDEAVGSAVKRRQIASFLKKRGFVHLGKGRWLGHRGKDTVSGLMIEGSPLDTYITGFMLPAFDKRDFITWSLGERIVNCSLGDDAKMECETAVDYYAKNYANIKSPDDLMEYIRTREIKGPYSIWAIYILYLRLGDFEAAVNYLDDDKCAQMGAGKSEQFNEISPFATARDKDGVFRVFEEWSAFSERIYGPLDPPFDVF